MVSQIDHCNLLLAEEHIEYGVGGCRPQSNSVAGEGLRDLQLPVAILKVTVLADLSRDVAVIIFDGREQLRKGSGAGLVSTGRCGHAQRLVWPFEIVHIAPAVEVLLGRVVVLEELTVDQLELGPPRRSGSARLCLGSGGGTAGRG